MPVGAFLRKLHRPPSEMSLAAAVFLLVLCGYLPTLADYLPGGDAGDLAAAACQGAVAHPPGYPLWLMAARLMLHLPWGSLIWRLSLMSALCGAGAAALLTATLVRLEVLWQAALLGAALYAFAGNVWFFAVTPEVFALAGFLVMVACYAAVRGATDPRWGWRFLCGIACGLAAANQQTCAAWCVPLALVCLVSAESPRVHGALALLAGGTLGLLPYLYLPFAGASQSIYSWGDATTWAGFWQHLLRVDYGTFRLASAQTSASLMHNLLLYGSYIVTETWGALVLLCSMGVLGLAARRSKARAVLCWMLAGTVFYLLAFHAAANLYLEYDLHRQVLSRFWIIPQLTVAMVSAIGCDSLARFFNGVPRQAIAWLSLLFVALLPFSHYQKADASGDDVIERFARADFAALPEGSIALVRDDLSFPLVYLKACEGVRPDVRLINRAFLTRSWSIPKIRRAYPDVALPGGLYTDRKAAGERDTYDLTDFIEQNVDRHPIFLHEFSPEMPEYEQTRGWTGRFDLLPWGLLTRVLRHEPGRDYARHDAENRRLLALFEPPRVERADRWDAVVRMVYIDAFYLRAMYLTEAQLHDAAVFPLALAALGEALAQPDQPRPRIFHTMGFAYAIEARRDPGARDKAIAAWREYLRLAPQEEPGRTQIEARIAALQQADPAPPRQND